LWTTLPTIIITVYAKFYSTMVEKLKNSQPMMELLDSPQRPGTSLLKRLRRDKTGAAQAEKSKPSTVERTLLLDYHKYWPLSDSWHAFQNRHYLVGVCMLINVALVVSSSLGAATFSTATVIVNSTTTISFTSFFDELTPDRKSALPSFDAASATLVSGASSGPWTTSQYSFNPFSGVNTPSRPGSLMGNTLAYYSTLDCVVIAEGDPSLILSAGGSTDSFTVNYTFTDRGCPVTQVVNVTPFDLFAKSWIEPHCNSSTVNARDHVRIGLIAGQHDATSATRLANTTLLSCIPTFWNATATVITAVNNATSRPGQQLDFSLSSSNATDFQPEFWQVWLENLPMYKSLDPGAEYNMDRLANIVYNLALVRDTSNPFNSTLLLLALPDVFNAVVATFVGKWAYKESTEQLLPGTFSALELRLFVVPGTTAAVLAVLFLALLSTVWTWVYVARNRDVLEREVKLMLGHAMLFQGSTDIAAYIEAVKQYASNRVVSLETIDLVKYTEKEPRLNNCECWMDRTDGKIRVERPDMEGNLEN
jgi:hypothetical protein